MAGMNFWKLAALVAIPAASLFIADVRLGADDLHQVSVADCTFSSDPDAFLGREGRARRELFDRAKAASRFGRARFAAPVEVSRHEIRNLVDEEIFGRLGQAGVRAAPLSSDETFLRRITLDLTGRIPPADEIRAFLADPSENKRSRLIHRLLVTQEFTEKWTMWMGDWLGNARTLATGANRQVNGRNAYFNWIQDAVYSQKSIKDIAYESVVASGNTFDNATGAANFPYGATTAMGPIQDTYDTMMSRTASIFLGLGQYDCLLCHNGRGHLDQLSLWGQRTTRVEAWKMASHFSRTRLAGRPAAEPACIAADSCRGMFHNGSIDVSDNAAGQYDLTNFYGNRPHRLPIGATRNIMPEYRVTGAKPGATGWRDAFAEQMVNDPMFARNVVNRLWKEMFGLALADPVDGLDPARLDPRNPPTEAKPDGTPWTLQATHPELLERLAAEFRAMNYQLRPFLQLLAESSAYQLDSRYDGDWKVEYIPLFARHYTRRMMAEEVFDAIATATGVPGSFAVNGFAERIKWAMQSPDTQEGAGAEGGILDVFLRGNRDTVARSQQGSIQQQLLLMNNAAVTNRTNVNNSPRLKAIAAQTDADAMLDELYLTFLSRTPTEYERSRGTPLLRRATTQNLRNAAIEDLAWVLINKVEFLFSY